MRSSLWIKIKRWTFVGLLGLIILWQITTVRADPTWVPTESDIPGYNQLWNDQIEREGFICTQQNLTIYTSVWYQNDSENHAVVFIAEALADLEVEFSSENLPLTSKIIIQLVFEDFSGNTGWDFFIYLLNKTYGGMYDITAELKGWNNAVECNVDETQYNYFIIGILDGTKLGVSFALVVDSDFWFGLLGEQIAAFIGGYISAIMLTVSFFLTIGYTCPSSSSIEQAAQGIPSSNIFSSPRSGDDTYTNRVDMLNFNSKIGLFINPKTMIPGYITGIVVGSFLIAIIIMKKKVISHQFCNLKH